MAVEIPTMMRGQTQSWHAALELFERKPAGWTLIGGQMVHLHCAERGLTPQRATDDIDAVLDVRAEPWVLRDVTTILGDLGFRPETTGKDRQRDEFRRASHQIEIAETDILSGRPLVRW